MRNVSIAVAFSLILTPPWSGSGLAASCTLSKTFKQADPRGARTVLYDASAVIFSSSMRVDADGGPHTYSAKDPMANLCDPKAHPENAGKDAAALGCAMDKLCYGVKVTVPGGQTLDDGQCQELADAFSRIRDSHWQPPTGYQLHEVGIELQEPNKPCLDANEAYIVSTSSTPSGEGGGACEQKKYLDTMVPSVVVPRCWSTSYRNANKERCDPYPRGKLADVEPGDLVAIHSRLDDRFFYGVVGDLGPDKKLGEASVGLLMQVARQTTPPTYVKATDSLDDEKYQLDVIVLKHTGFDKPLILANVADMAAAAEGAFAKWGGDITAAQQQLATCGKTVAP